MWTPIFVQNADEVLPAIDAFLAEVKTFRDALASRDAARLDALIRNANRIKELLR